MSNMLRGHVSCSRGCCRSKPGRIESARAVDKRNAQGVIREETLYTEEEWQQAEWDALIFNCDCC